MTMVINAKTLNAIDLLIRDGAAHYTPLNAIDLFPLIKSVLRKSPSKKNSCLWMLGKAQNIQKPCSFNYEMTTSTNKEKICSQNVCLPVSVTAKKKRAFRVCRAQNL